MEQFVIFLVALYSASQSSAEIFHGWFLAGPIQSLSAVTLMGTNIKQQMLSLIDRENWSLCSQVLLQAKIATVCSNINQLFPFFLNPRYTWQGGQVSIV